MDLRHHSEELVSAAHDGRPANHYGGSFARMPEHVIYMADARGARHVLEAIIHRSDYRTGLTNGNCSVRQLADALDLSPGTVHEHIGRLVAAGLLIVNLPGTGVRPTRYRLPWMGGEVIHSARPHRALAVLGEELARGHTARSARPDRALARGHTARLYTETDVFQSACPHPYPCSCDACVAWIEERRASVRYDSHGGL